MDSLVDAGPVIQARGLGKWFGDVEAVRDLSFSVAAGHVVGVLGPNGAGKTTTIKMLTTLFSLDAGSASVGGFDVQGQPDVVRQLIGVAGQSAAVDEKLTARENLELFCRLYKIPRAARKERIGELLERFDMDSFADRPAATYSGGQKRRLDVVAALVASPPALFLDEPTAGLDPRGRAELWEAIRKLAEQGAAIVLTTQYLEEADQLADHILMIDHGQIVAEGSPTMLKRDLERDVLEVRFADGSDLSVALDIVGPVDGVASDPQEHRIRVPIGDDSALALKLLRRLQDRGLTISDFQLRRPTLDDVFLALTGASAAVEQEKT